MQQAVFMYPDCILFLYREALDQKTPLLRSMEAVNTQALRLLRLFGNTTSKKVTPSLELSRNISWLTSRNGSREKT